MNRDALTAALVQADDAAGWVAIVAEAFAAAPLHFGHGAAAPEDEAYWLVWQSFGRPESLAALNGDPALAARVAALAARRVGERVPLAYLLGSAWFAGLEFAVDRHVLIPRSPLAEIVEQSFRPWIELRPGDRILEVGTGSGCIAIAAAVYSPGIEVDATEIDPAALAVARANVGRHGVAGRVHLLEADLYPSVAARYRVIISNPPYVPTAELSLLPAEYGHEPAGALDGGADGLDVVRRLLEGAARRLTAGGMLIVEVGLAAEALEAAYPRVPWTWIDFERGGEGVFALTADELKDGWG